MKHQEVGVGESRRIPRPRPSHVTIRTSWDLTRRENKTAKKKAPNSSNKTEINSQVLHAEKSWWPLPLLSFLCLTQAQSLDTRPSELNGISMGWAFPPSPSFQRTPTSSSSVSQRMPRSSRALPLSITSSHPPFLGDCGFLTANRSCGYLLPDILDSRDTRGAVSTKLDKYSQKSTIHVGYIRSTREKLGNPPGACNGLSLRQHYL